MQAAFGAGINTGLNNSTQELLKQRLVVKQSVL